MRAQDLHSAFTFHRPKTVFVRTLC